MFNLKFKLVSINWGSLKAMMNLLQQFKILPSEEKFYTYIETLAQKAHFSTQTLQVILNQETLKGSDLAVVEMTKAKREAKETFEHLTAELCKTFVTPFDREDIQAFGLDLYKISKVVEKALAQITAHQITPVNGDLNRQTTLIIKASDLLVEVVELLHTSRDSKLIYEKSAQIHQWEEEADAVLLQLTVELFNNMSDPKEWILRKSLYDMLEQVIDYHRDAANVALRIMLKHS